MLLLNASHSICKMQLIHIFIALTFFLAVSSAIATDALEAFYEGADSLQDVSAYNSSELCWLKWKRTFGRWKNCNYIRCIIIN